MTVLIPAQRPAPATETIPDAATFARWAYEAHTAECAECRRGDTWCEAGRRFLAATAPTRYDDLPGYPAI